MRFYCDTDWYDACQTESKVAYYDCGPGRGGTSLLYAGHAKIEAGNCIGPVMRYHYIYHLVLHGRGVFRMNDLEWPVSASEGFLVFPGQMVSYEPDENDPWAYYYVAFCGEDIPYLAEKIGLSLEDPIVRHGDMAPCRRLINTLIDNIRRNDEISEIAIPAILQLLLCSLGDDKHALTGRQIRKSNNVTNQYVNHALHMIQNTYNKPLNIVDIAATLGIDPSYFSRIFKKNCGTSPAVYIQHYRLMVAQTMLIRSSMSVKEIAYRVGFEDPSYFTRCFTRKFGVTPSNARQNPVGKPLPAIRPVS